MAARTRLGALLLAAACLLTACDSDFEGTRLRVAGGFRDGVYYNLSRSLSASWRTQTGVEAEVLETSGSPDNMDLLTSGRTDIALSAADVAEQPTTGPRKPRALARIHTDYLHLVVRDELPINDLKDLRGRRVSLGSDNSGVKFIARRVLDAADLGQAEMDRVSYGLTRSVEAFRAREIDAFFWSGGLPTTAISKLAKDEPIRLIDLGAYLPGLRSDFPIYDSASIPASTYGLRQNTAVTTLSVPNYLLVSDAMPDELAETLVRGMFDDQDALAKANPAALSIDVHAAIETEPVPLHPGAERFYRDEKE